MAEGIGTWVYAIGPPFRVESLMDLTGVDQEPVRAVARSDLVAVVGSVDFERFGETALRRNLEDLRWLEACSRRHHRVVEAVTRLVPVVPMPLAIIFRDDAGALGMLAVRRADILSTLRRLKGRAEWGVKVYSAPKATVSTADAQGERATVGSSKRGARSDEAFDAPEGHETGGSGTAYLRRRQAELSADEVSRRAAAVSAHQVHLTLARLAVATHSRQPQDPRLHQEARAMLLNSAYLLDDDRVEEFVAAVAALDDRIDNVRVELTGPWPPYSFATVGDPGGCP